MPTEREKLLREINAAVDFHYDTTRSQCHVRIKRAIAALPYFAEQPADAAEGKGERPPMLRARAGFRSDYHWWCPQEREFHHLYPGKVSVVWGSVDTPDRYSVSSGSMAAIDRTRSDPEALALYDRERAAGGEG